MGTEMAHSAGSAKGAGLVLLIGFVWVMGRCSGEPAEISVAPTPTAAASGLAASPPPPPESRYVDASTLNLRDGPDGAVVGKAGRGTELAVHERRDGWIRVVADGRSGWVAERYTCGTSGCARRAPPPSVSQSRATHSQSWTGGCPCSGLHNCTGPRGGRYCITSGGNKRYR